MGYSIRFVSQITNINEHTIRAWEKRYGLVGPKRDSNGKRIFTDSQIDYLNKIKDLIDEGHSISSLAKLDIPELDKLYKECSVKKESRKVLKDLSDKSSDVEKAIISLALNDRRLDILCHEFASMDPENPRPFLEHKLIPLYHMALRQKEQGEKNFSTVVIRLIKNELLKIIYSLHDEKSEESYLVGSFSGVRSEVEALFAALEAASEKKRIICLGPSVTFDGLQEFIKIFGPQGGLLSQRGKSFIGATKDFCGLELSSSSVTSIGRSKIWELKSNPLLSLSPLDYCPLPVASSEV